MEDAKKNKFETISTWVVFMKAVKAPELSTFVFMKTLKKITNNEDPRVEREISEDSVFITHYDKFQFYSLTNPRKLHELGIVELI